MKLFPEAPDPQRVNNHFLKMAKGELHGRRVQVGYGFAGSRLNLNASSRLEKQGSSPEMVVKQVTPGQVGVQQARSQLLANELKRKTAGKQIKRLLSSVSRQKPSGKSRRKTSTAGKNRTSKPQKKKKKSIKKPTVPKKRHVKKKKKKQQSARSRDNFSR